MFQLYFLAIFWELVDFFDVCSLFSSSLYTIKIIIKMKICISFNNNNIIEVCQISWNVTCKHWKNKQLPEDDKELRSKYVGGVIIK